MHNHTVSKNNSSHTTDFKLTGDTLLKDKDLYTSEINSIFESYKTSPQGLASSERSLRLKVFGPNTLPKSEQDGPFKIFLRQIHNPLIYVLLISAAAAIFMGKFTDAFVVLAVVVANSIIGFIQEFKAGKAIEALSSMVPQTSTVLIDGIPSEVQSKDIVPGDILVLKSGDKVSADIRLFEAKSLKIEEAALTGESVAAEKKAIQLQGEIPLADRENMAYSGTLVTYGTGYGIAVGTGAHTELGKISHLLQSTTQINTPLTESLNKFGKILTYAILAVALSLIGIGYLKNFPFFDSILAAITLAVAAIPEGLPAIVTMTLALGVRRMALKRAVIRKLPAVETLGSATVICSDKTGTLTKNEMTVQAVWTNEKTYRIQGAGYEPKGDILFDGVIQTHIQNHLMNILKAGVLCNDSRVYQENEKWMIQGDPTEAALLVSYLKARGNIENLNLEHERLDVLPFESDIQYMATLNKGLLGSPNSSENILILKGAPEVIFSKCQDIGSAREQLSKLAQQGMRVLAFASKKVSTHKIKNVDLVSGFEFLGLQAMIDPPRSEVIQAIQDCHNAGITVKMITGDHKITATAIAKEIGILNGSPAYSGEELAKLSEDELLKVSLITNVFARVTPEQKLKLVKCLQASKQIVSMTGDGVNDAPALKQANIGVAMGITGTSVSKESADLILTDDNFTSIRHAVEEGRRIYDNLVKSLAFVLPTNLGEALIILVAVAFFPVLNGQVIMPILPVQILWINLVATVALALPLAFEQPEADIMKRPPRDPKEPILNQFVFWRTLIVAILMTLGAIGLFLYEYNKSLSLGLSQSVALQQSQTMAVTTVIFFQIFYLLNCRSLKNSIFSIGFFSNKYIFVGIFILICLQILFVHSSWMQNLFLSYPLSIESWIKAAAVGFIVVPVIAIEKWIRSRF